jgi:hypothetical protein
MPETTVRFYATSLDHRIQARGEIQWARENSYVLSVRPSVDTTRDEPRWVINHAEVSEHDEESLEQGELARWLRRHEYVQEAPPSVDPTQQGWMGGLFRRLANLVETPTYRESLVSRAIASAEGRSRLAAAMAAPLRARRDYQGIARRALLVEPMPEGASPIYIPGSGGQTMAEMGRLLSEAPLQPTRMYMAEQDFADIQAWSAQEEVGPTVVNPNAINRRAMVPEFEIFSNPTVTLQEIQSRRFSLIDRGATLSPPPEWAGVGVWIRSKKDSSDIWQITGMDDRNVTVEVWRGIYKSNVWAFGHLVSHYEPCMAPMAVPNRFERLGLDL